MPPPAPPHGLLTLARFADTAGLGPRVEAANVMGAMLLAVGRRLVGPWTFLQVMNVVRYCPRLGPFSSRPGIAPGPRREFFLSIL